MLDSLSSASSKTQILSEAEDTTLEDCLPLDAQPFQLKRIFGHNTKVPVVNLTQLEKDDEQLIAYAAGHTITIYNSFDKTSRYLTGHSGEIFFLAADKTGRFVLSVDDECAIVWDRRNTTGGPQPIREITTKNFQITKAAFSWDAKYFLLASKTTVQLWIWSKYENDQPNGIFEMPKGLMEVKNMQFSHIDTENFVVTMSTGIIVGQWMSQEKKIEIEMPRKTPVGVKSLSNSIFVTSTRIASIELTGNAVVWERNNDQWAFVKLIHLCYCPLNVILMIDELICIATDHNDVKFFDEEFRIVYYLHLFGKEKEHSILSISFNLSQRQIKLIDLVQFEEETENEAANKQMERFFPENIPTDATVLSEPFIMRSFVVATNTGKVVKCDILSGTVEQILYEANTTIRTIETHPEKPWVCCGYANGLLVCYDYTSGTIVAQERVSTFPITSIKFSHSGQVCVCASGHGHFSYIDPIIFKVIKTRHYSENKIMNIIFTKSDDLLAYYDQVGTVVVLRFDIEWHILGKHHFHTMPIRNFLFIESIPGCLKLLTYAEDCWCVEYDLNASLKEKTLVMFKTNRIDQTARLKSGTLIELDDQSNMILTSDNQYKLKTWKPTDLSLCQTCIGPVFDGPIITMKSWTNFVVFANNNKTVGIQLLPVDGNPFKSIGMICHPGQIQTLLLTSNGRHIFTLAHRDTSMFMWTIQLDVVMENVKFGGSHLSPFTYAIPGGRSGWFFKEMQDLFYYFQIISKSQNTPEEYDINDYIALTEVGDYMRALGFFPSEYEIENMQREIMAPEGQLLGTNISFEQIVKLYINHKPYSGINIKEIVEAVEYFAGQSRSDEFYDMPTVKNNEHVLLDQDQLFSACTQSGEPMTRLQTAQCLSVLLGDEKQLPKDDSAKEYEEERIYTLLRDLPEVFTVSDFLEKLLGLNVTKNENGQFIVSPDQSEELFED